MLGFQVHLQFFQYWKDLTTGWTLLGRDTKRRCVQGLQDPDEFPCFLVLILSDYFQPSRKIHAKNPQTT